MEQRKEVYGPMVKGNMAMDVAVQRTYAGTPRRPVLWRGTLTLFMAGSPFMDIEATLLESKTGGQSFITWPQREYQTPGGDKKWKNMVWMHDKDMAVACAEAVRKSMSDFDPLEEVSR